MSSRGAAADLGIGLGVRDAAAMKWCVLGCCRFLQVRAEEAESGAWLRGSRAELWRCNGRFAAGAADRLAGFCMLRVLCGLLRECAPRTGRIGVVTAGCVEGATARLRGEQRGRN